jgi:hypothetical protein
VARQRNDQRVVVHNHAARVDGSMLVLGVAALGLAVFAVVFYLLRFELLALVLGFSAVGWGSGTTRRYVAHRNRAHAARFSLAQKNPHLTEEDLPSPGVSLALYELERDREGLRALPPAGPRPVVIQLYDKFSADRKRRERRW